MIGLRVLPLATGLAAWIAVHALLPVLTLDDTTRPALTLALGLLVAAASTTSLLPLVRGRVPVRWPAAVVYTALPPVAALVVGASVQPGALASYATWWPGAAGPVLAALTLRGRPRAAAFSGASSLLLLWVLFADRWDREQLQGWASHAVVYSLPVLFWCVGAVVVDRLLVRSTLLVRSSQRARDDAGTQQREALGRACDRRSREALLRQHAVPVLTEVADARRPLDEDLRARAGAAEAALRRELRGGDLLDDAVRSAVDRARDRGVVVDLLDDADRGSPPRGAAVVVDAGLTRRLVERAVAGAVDGHLTARRPPGDGVALTVVHDASGDSITRVAQALRPWSDGAREARLPSGVELDLDAGDGVLIAELRGPSAPEEAEDPPAPRR